MAQRIKPEKTARGAIRIGPTGTSFGRSVVLANPSDRDYAKHRYILWFGACGTTNIMVWANSLEDAIEEAADWLATHAPGHIIPTWSDEHKELIAEACGERDVTFPQGFEALDDGERDEICQDAEADLTCTESGYLTSYEWGIQLEDPTRAELDAFLYPPGLDWTAERAA